MVTVGAAATGPTFVLPLDGKLASSTVGTRLPPEPIPHIFGSGLPPPVVRRYNFPAQSERGIRKHPEQLRILLRVSNVHHEVRAVEGAGLHSAAEIGRDGHRRRAGAGRAGPAAAPHPEPAD